MQRQQNYQPQLFVYTDIASLIPKSHFLRKLDQFLDLKFIRDISSSYYSKDQERPSIDPEVFFRMVLIGYL